jgi:xanthine dehydrogenase YagR molybdenum-binding subunit
MGNRNTTTHIGEPEDRVEARAKVTGQAKYAAEYKPDNLCYGVLVTSTIACGRITAIDTAKAKQSPGVLNILTHQNRPEVPGWNQPAKGDSRLEGQAFRVFYDEHIYFNQQPVALVIADTFERATEAAMLVTVTYQREDHATDLKAHVSEAVKPKRAEDFKKGDPQTWHTAPVKIDVEYTTPIQVHNPMEMHAATVVWKSAGEVMDYNKTQASILAQKEIATAFDLKPELVEVHSPFVGGAFGSSSRVWPQEMAALLGSKLVGRPVVVVARRDQVFNMVGYRPESVQQVQIGAKEDGALVAIRHIATGMTSRYEEFTERIIDPTKAMYACPNIEATYRLVKLDMSTPCWTRAPGETSGSFALESAMDELSYALKMDPIALRLKNYAEKDPEKGLPWSSKFLYACYATGAERFGWNKRNPTPRSMQQDGWLLGMGMSGGVYAANRAPAAVSAALDTNGKLIIQTSVADVGPGSVTVMTQIAAEAFGVDISQIEFHWGNSLLPPAPGQFGSHTTASVGAAVYEACRALQERIKEIAVNTQDSPFINQNTPDLYFEKGTLKSKSGESVPASDIKKRKQLTQLKVTRQTSIGPEKEAFASYSFCASFVEVLVHPRTGMIKANRVVSVVDAGRIINKKTATSQVYGSVTWGLGIALMEEGVRDHRYGRYVNNNLADYHVPVNADIPPIDVVFIDKPDPILDPMGSKGLGEIALVGFSAAVANAVYHATGKRIRSLPLTPDKVLGE